MRKIIVLAVLALTIASCVSESVQSRQKRLGEEAARAAAEEAKQRKVRQAEKQYQEILKEWDPGPAWREQVVGPKQSACEAWKAYQRLHDFRENTKDYFPPNKDDGLRHNVRSAAKNFVTAAIAARNVDGFECRGEMGGFDSVYNLLDKIINALTEEGVTPEEAGVTPALLREYLLTAAKREVTKLRPRIKEGSSDAAGALTTYLERFTADELGLTREEREAIER